MLNNVDNSLGSLTATNNGGYAISEAVYLAENMSTGSTANIFACKESLLSGNRISIVVNGEYINTKIEEENIISVSPFEYNTTSITNGAVPSEVFFTGDLRVEVEDISMNVEFANIATASSVGVLAINRDIAEDNNLLIAMSDKTIHKVRHDKITPGDLIPKIRYIRDYQNGTTGGNATHVWVEIQAFEVETGVNRALSSNGATIFGSAPAYSGYPYSRIIDGNIAGDIAASADSSSWGSRQYVQIDLGDMYDIESINVRHYFLDLRTCAETETQVSLDGITWITMFSSEVSGVYQESSSGHAIPIVAGPMTRTLSFEPRVRYIRDYLDGSSSNEGNHWVEIQALEADTGVNRALASNGATIFGSVPAASSYPFSVVIDGNTNTSPYSACVVNGLQYVQIDLGGQYDIETIKVWHYYGDGRTYYSTKTQVSIDGIEWFDIYDSEISGTYPEGASGFTIPIVDGPAASVSYVVDTTFVADAGVPVGAYIANMELSFGGVVAKDENIKYSIIGNGESLHASISKRAVSFISDKAEARIDFTSKGDKVIDTNYKASILLNDRYYAPTRIVRGESAVVANQSIIFPMK